MPTLHDFTVETIDGESRALSAYAGKTVLVVNVASACGLTPQYEGLEALQRRYADRGFVVLGFPCNQFGQQEPGTHAEIKDFCTTKFDVTFPLFAKLEVNGDGRAPVYGFLTGAQTEPDGSGDIAWNFAKFLIDREGRVAARFAPMVKPDDPDLIARIEALLD